MELTLFQPGVDSALLLKIKDYSRTRYRNKSLFTPKNREKNTQQGY